jgi:hypothetical protein
MMPPCSWSLAGHKAGDVDEGEQRYVEAVAEADKARGLHGRGDVEHSGQHGRLIGDDPDAATVHAREADDDVHRHLGLDFEKSTESTMRRISSLMS